MQDLARRVEPDPDRYTVDVHAGPDGVYVDGRKLNAEEFADLIRRDPNWDGKPIRLLGCDTGSADFARDLARHLGVPVTAPTKPVWSDSSGRVFATDFELGPDGNLRPKWPPNGEWRTFEPDGSSRTVGDGGFPPRRDGDTGPSQRDPGERPDDARARSATQGPEFERLLKEKINNSEWRRKYYYEREGQPVRYRTDARDEEIGQVPKIRYNEETKTYELATDDYIPSKFKDVPPPTPRELTEAEKKKFDELIEKRAEANERVRRAEERYEKDPTEENLEERRNAHRERTDIGEELGDLATERGVRDHVAEIAPERWPGREVELTPHHRPGAGAGHFDQIWEIKDKNTGETLHYVVAEAKGPSADLGTRRGLDGKNYQQGHREYFRSILGAMRKRGEDDLADELEDALMAGNLDYVLGRPKIKGSGKSAEYDGYDLKHFDLSVG